jgi:hypothetical protein
MSLAPSEFFGSIEALPHDVRKPKNIIVKKRFNFIKAST